MMISLHIKPERLSSFTSECEGMRSCQVSHLRQSLELAATYYVDSREGNDISPGTAPETVWKILERVNKTA